MSREIERTGTVSLLVNHEAAQCMRSCVRCRHATQSTGRTVKQPSRPDMLALELLVGVVFNSALGPGMPGEASQWVAVSSDQRIPT